MIRPSGFETLLAGQIRTAGFQDAIAKAIQSSAEVATFTSAGDRRLRAGLRINHRKEVDFRPTLRATRSDGRHRRRTPAGGRLRVLDRS